MPPASETMLLILGTLQSITRILIPICSFLRAYRIYRVHGVSIIPGISNTPGIPDPLY